MTKFLLFFLLSTQLLSAATTEITIPLKAGWNLISLGITPEVSAITSIFERIPDMRYVMGFFRSAADSGTEGFRTYMNQDGIKEFSTLTSMDGKHGYWVYMSGSSTLEVTGSRLPEETEFPLSQGWNLCGYWRDSQEILPFSSSSDSVIDSVYGEKAISGTAGYVMGFYRTGTEGFRTFMNNQARSFSTLTSLDPKMGYWFYMNQAGSLRYNQMPLPPDRIRSGLSASPARVSVTAGQSVSVSSFLISAVYRDGFSLPVHDAVWKKVSGPGTFSGSTFTAGNTPGNTVLAAELNQNGITLEVKVSIETVTAQSAYTDLSTTSAAVKVYITAAEALLALSNFSGAQSSFLSAVTSDPINVEANFGLGLLKLASLISSDNLQSIAMTFLDSEEYAEFPKTISDLISSSSKAPALLSSVPGYLSGRKTPVKQDTVSGLQQQITTLLQSLSEIETCLKKALAKPDFSYSIASAVTGGQNALTLGPEAPSSMLVTVCFLEAFLNYLNSYNLDCNIAQLSENPEYIPFEDTSYPLFGTLKTNGQSSMTSSGQKFSDAVFYLMKTVNYAFDNASTLASKYNLEKLNPDSISRNDLLTQLGHLRNSLDYADYPLTLIFNQGTTREMAVSVSLYSFFNNPVNFRSYFSSIKDKELQDFPENLDFSLNGLLKINGTSPALADMLRLVYEAEYFKSFVPGTVFRTVTVDGDLSDWNGVSPVCTDPEDLENTYIQSDIKSLYLAYDNDFYYIAVQFYGNSTPPDISVDYQWGINGSIEVNGGWWASGNPDVVSGYQNRFSGSSAKGPGIIEVKVSKTGNLGAVMNRFSVTSVSTMPFFHSNQDMKDRLQLPDLAGFPGSENLMFSAPEIWKTGYDPGHSSGPAFYFIPEINGISTQTKEIIVHAEYFNSSDSLWKSCTPVYGKTAVYDPSDSHRVMNYVWNTAADNVSSVETGKFRMRLSVLDSSGTRLYGEWALFQQNGLYFW